MTGKEQDHRYSRQTVLSVIGQEGQERLGRATVLIVGCGALGSLQAGWLARAGIGRLILVDRDILELHNLHRQALYDEQDVHDRLPKAVAAARHLRAINSLVHVEERVADVTAENIAGLLEEADMALDATDNFETRYLLNDAAIQQGKCWIYGGVLGTEGNVMPVYPGEGPCLRCLLPEPPPPGALPACELHGVLATAVAWVAALQTTYAMKYLVGAERMPVHLHTADIWQGAFHRSNIRRHTDCTCCVEHRFDFLDNRSGTANSVLCGRQAVQLTPESPTHPDLEQLAGKLAAVGATRFNGLLLEAEIGPHRLVIFPDGRILVMGTTDPALARTLAAKYIGM